MPPTPPGPLGDCLRDWEELQQDFQSIQVSTNAGTHWPQAMSLWLGGSRVCQFCIRQRGARGQALGSLVLFPSAARTRVPVSWLDSPLDLT